MPPVRFAAQASKRAADPRREGSLSDTGVKTYRCSRSSDYRIEGMSIRPKRLRIVLNRSKTRDQELPQGDHGGYSVAIVLRRVLRGTVGEDACSRVRRRS